MKQLRVVTTERIAPDLRSALQIPCEISTFDSQSSDEAVASLTATADAFVGAEFRAAWTSNSLRLVQVPGAGADGIDRAGLPPGCRLCNVYGHERAVAEHVFLLALALNKDLFSLDRNFRKGSWRWEDRMTPELRGRKMLVLGLGRIGAELARWGQFFRMEVSGVSRTLSAERAAELGLADSGTFADLPRLLPTADFVVVALPATPETTDLLDANAFSLMKPTAFFINVGRAPVANEAALYEALRDRRIAGAGLDVWYQYPKPGEDRLPSQLPFWDLENVIMTPHNGGLTPETMQARWVAIAENLRRLAAGEPLDYILLTA